MPGKGDKTPPWDLLILLAIFVVFTLLINFPIKEFVDLVAHAMVGVTVLYVIYVIYKFARK